MQFKRPGWAASGLRARRRERQGFRRRECDEALLTIYFGIDMCDTYMHDAIMQDMTEDFSEFRVDELPTQMNLKSIPKLKTSKLRFHRAETLVDQNATKVLVEIP